MSVVTDEQVAAFQRDGFVVVENALEAGEIDELLGR